ncbi:hypothetical protein [Oceanibacterium hippocampi]|uniref:Uncharacterized protein n=1 Tax=Oceanibacterium hippocampi TaxID=745714 RepID=A0A1Y5TY11_9PROT|nr:hypothetical protein [Oceanibacterium hippocampi]SLN70787.1 hypothetical protein OCH7691_03320 [Oceanibacterium hippocampi]
MSAGKLSTLVLTPLLMALLGAAPAQAYIGPGAGAGAIAVVVGILAAIVMAFFAVLWYPVKRVLRKRRQARQGDRDGSPEAPERPGNS